MKKFIASILTAALLFSCAGGLVSAAGEPAVKGSSSVVSDVSVDQFSFTQVNEQGITDFVTRMYQVCLGRKPDANGLKDWTGQLTGGKATGISVSFGFIFSKELQEKNLPNDEYIEIMYQAFFGRKSDPTGKQYWLDKMNGGMSRSDLFAGFANSKEFYDLCRSYGIIAGTYVPGQDRNRVAQVNLFVERLYNVVLGRTCDQTGMENWTNNLLKGKISGADAAYGFFFSPEYEAKRKTYTQYVTDLYNALMGRGPDDTGKGYWLNQMYAGTGSKEHVFNGFAQSNEFNGICTNYGIVRGGLISESRDTTYTLINDNPYGAGNNGSGGNNGGNSGNGGNNGGNNGNNMIVPVSPEETAKEYKYEITPVVSPLNRVFYLKTDDPFVADMSFVDYSSVFYSKDSEPDELTFCNFKYLDVAYEKEETFRVKGGYLFSSTNMKTDGGELTIRINGKDTSVKVNCPKVVDSVQYLIDTYGSKDKDLFDNLSAIRTGLSSIAVYPRGTRDSSKQIRPYPCYATSPYSELALNVHVVEMFETCSCYTLLSDTFPYTLSSLGFPSMMSAVASRLAPDCTVKQGATHNAITVTYKGTTRSYEGVGRGTNDFIDINDIVPVFKFDGSSADLFSNCSMKALGDTYTGYKSEILDTYKKMLSDAYNSLPNGTWIKTANEGGGTSFAYISKLYPGGSNISFENVWADGRYVSSNNCFEKGATFNSHPTADIIITSMTYKDKKGNSHTGPVYFEYESSTKDWRAHYAYSNASYWSSNDVLPDDLILTSSEVSALKVDRNTNKDITSGYLFDGSAAPGTKMGSSGQTEPVSEKVVAINQKAFPDETFRKWVSDVCDSDKDGYLSKAEISERKKVDVNAGVSSAKGIEYFTEAESIYINTTKLQSVDLSKNTKITLLSIRHTPMTSIDLSKNTELLFLEATENKFTSLNLKSNTKLLYLSCEVNALSSLELSKNTKLKYLDCSRNKISSLDLSKCSDLEIAYVSNNSIGSLNIAGLKKLKMLSCFSNKITSIDISSSIFLKETVSRGNATGGAYYTYVISSASYEIDLYPLDAVIMVNKEYYDPDRAGMIKNVKGGYLINVDNAVKLYI